jgi:hypothetical protein
MASRIANESSIVETYKLGKIPLASIDKKSNNENGTQPPKKKRKCGNCGGEGHTGTSCLQPGAGRKGKSSTLSRGQGKNMITEPNWFNLLH